MRILDFPVLRQTFSYDCGAKAIQAVLVYYGIEIREDKIIKSARTCEEGTPIDGVVETVNKYGLKYISKKMSISDIKMFINKEIPVIVIIQAWADKENVDWENSWDYGHYTTVIGYDSEKIYFSDPSSFKRVFLYYEEFEQRWHDVDINGKKVMNHGIAIYGKKNTYNSKNIRHLD